MAILEPIVKHIIATSIEYAWYSALDMVMTKGRKYLIDSGSFEKTHRRTLPLVIEMHNPGTRPLAPLMPEGSNISPPTTEEAIHKYMESLISPEKKPDQHYTYGQDLSWQIEEVIKYFKKYGFNTACCQMQIGRPESIFFYNRDVDYCERIIVSNRTTKEIEWTRDISNSWNKDEKEEMSTQCLRSVDAWIENNKLYFWCYFRSQDLWGGFPENYGGLQLVKEYMAEMIGIEDGPMIASGKDIHVYEYAWLTAFMRLRKNPEDYL